MRLVRFPDRATYLAWHDTACSDRAIPRPGRRASDAEPMPNNQWTVAYVQPFGLTGFTGIFTWVEDADVTTYNLTLATREQVTEATAPETVVEQPPATRTQPTTVVIDGRTYTRIDGVYREG